MSDKTNTTPKIPDTNDQDTKEQAPDKLAALQAEIADLKKQMAAIVSANTQVPEKDEAPVIPDQTFKVDKKKYKFRFAKFTIPGVGTRTALEALNDKDTLKLIVEKYRGLVEEVF